MSTPEPVNIAYFLKKMADQQPYSKAIIYPEGRDKNGNVSYTHYTFQQLDYQSDIISKGLEAYGIKRGCRTVLMVKPSLDFFALTFALFKAGIVPVLIDPGIGLENLKVCIGEAQPDAFIGITKAHVARIALGWGKATINKRVTVGKKFFWEGATLDEIKALGKQASDFSLAEVKPDDMAAILFTSGSTGVPKGVVYTYDNFYNQVQKIKKLYNIQPGEIDLPTFPPFALFDPAFGMTAVIPDMDPTKPAQVDPVKIIEAINNFGVTNMFGSPALINRVGRYIEEHDIKLPTLRRAVSAGAPVPSLVMQRFSTGMNKEAQIFTPYGATESLPVCSIGSNELLNETRFLTDKGKGVCLGKPVEGMDVKIIKISDDRILNWSDDLVLPNYEVGEITVKGPVVSRSYFNREQSNDLAKISDKNDTFRHRMGDLGYYDEQGRIWFCGRKAHRIITDTAVYYSIPCESVFNTHKEVYRSALVGVSKNGKKIPLICIELEKDSTSYQNEIKNDLLKIASEFEHTKEIKDILFHPSFPVDIRHNAKIFREKLALWAQGELK